MNIFDTYWSKIGWKNFEDISLYLAESIFKERRFEIYGRYGEDHDGIDIISKDERGEEVICIQCKRYEEMDLSTLKKDYWTLLPCSRLESDQHVLANVMF